MSDQPFAPGTGEAFGSRGSFCWVPHRRLSDVRADDVVVLGAPFDWGASHRPGARFGPRVIREADYLPPDGSRLHLATGIDPLTELPVVDAGDIEIHFDAHADTSEDQWGAVVRPQHPDAATGGGRRRAGHRIVQIGVRGYWPPPDVVAWMCEQRMRTYVMAEIVERGLDPVVDDAVEYASSPEPGR